jgi:hypothetical protein
MKGKDAAMLGLVVTVSLPVVAMAQGLGDAAVRERARREKQAASGHDGRRFSNDDLEQGKPTGAGKTKKKTSSSPASSEQAPSSTRDTATSSESGPPSPRSEPSEPASPPESATAALEARIQRLQDKLNPMSGSFIYGASGSGDANEELRVRSELQQAEAELARARQASSGAPAPPQERNEPVPQ